MGFFKWLMKAQREYNEKQADKSFERLKVTRKLDEEGVVYCPKCLSTQISANKKGFSAKKAIIGDIVAGPVGLVAGAIGSKKVEVTCLKCGYKWEAGKK